MKLYHVTTERKAKLYRETGFIKQPVRGFNTLLAAMAWAMKVGRKVIYEVTEDAQGVVWMLPDHHNEFGKAFWINADVPVANIKCVYSAGRACQECAK